MLRHYPLLSMRRYLTLPSHPLFFLFLLSFLLVGPPAEEKIPGRVRSLPTLTSLQMSTGRPFPNSPALPLEPFKVMNVKPAVLLRILIVEDSLPIMKVVCQMLKQKGELDSAFLTSSFPPQSDRVIKCCQTALTSCWLFISIGLPFYPSSLYNTIFPSLCPHETQYFKILFHFTSLYVLP